jgi:hypothetical protein
MRSWLDGSYRVQVEVDETNDVADRGDIMRGVPRITAFLRELLDEPNLPESKVYHWIANRHIPTGSIGALKTASKIVLRKALRGEV